MTGQVFKGIGAFLLVMVLITFVVFVIQGSDFFLYRFWAPKYADAQHKVYERNMAHVDGINQEIENMYVEWTSATQEATKNALAENMRRKANTLNDEDLTIHVRQILATVGR